MGMIANYQPTTDIELEKIMCLDDVEELQESEDIEICDIDKMWDALHFLLTGKSASEPIEDDLISEAIVGQFNISEEDFISGTKADSAPARARRAGSPCLFSYAHAPEPDSSGPSPI